MKLTELIKNVTVFTRVSHACASCKNFKFIFATQKEYSKKCKIAKKVKEEVGEEKFKNYIEVFSKQKKKNDCPYWKQGEEIARYTLNRGNK